MEQKSFGMFIKAIEDRTVSGVTAVFGNIDAGGDRIHKGAFKKTIKEQATRVRHLWMHDYTQPPTAAVRELREIDAADLPEQVLAEFPEATGGLLVVREYLRTPRGDEILEGIRTGAISEMSIGYDPIKFDFEEDEEQGWLIRNLREMRLWDTSDVTWGMNPATVASKMAPHLEGWKDLLGEERFTLLADLVAITEGATAPTMLKEGRVLSKRNMERLKNALAVLQDILLAAEPLDEDDEKATRALTEQVLRKLAIAERELTFLSVR